MKKLISFLMAAVLTFGLTVTAFAAQEEATGSITIKDSETVSVSGKTFHAYKVMDASFVDPSNAKKGIAYTVPEALADFYAEKYTLQKEDASFDEEVAAKIAEEHDLNVFAKEVLAAAKKAQIEPVTAVAGDHVTSVKIENLLPGYYVIEDVGAATPISALALDTTTVDAEIILKADKPSMDKKIDGHNDTDPSTNGPVESNNAAIGDKVPFILTSKVPDMTGYTKYFYIVNDTLSKGLTFNDDVEITVGEETLQKNTDYTVEQTGTEDGATAVKIVFKDFYNKNKAKAGQTITIKYSATVDTDAVIGTKGNPNKVTLDYSNNPNIVPEGENEPAPGDKEKGVIGTTPESITKTFVTGIEITKVDEKGNRLAGAEFKLEGERLNTVLVKKDVYSLDERGEYWKLKDGTYTKEAPGDETGDQYESQSDKYALKTETSTLTKQEHVEYKGTVGTDGVLRFDGLSAGDYVITELKAPEGYNLLKEPVRVTITCSLPERISDDCTWKVTEPGKEEGGIIKLSITNKTGAELPSTGGMGTTVFYLIGGLLVILAVVIFIVRKRMSYEK